MGKLPFEDVKRKILAKKEAKTSPDYGCFPDKRPVTELINYGIVNIDKPAGPTSHQVSDYLQRILGITKAGHSGTLDPGVTGVLPIALGRATRIVETLLTAGKEYVAVMHLHGKIEEDEIRKTLKGFVGKIKQIPPLKSSVKRVEREREIYYLDILEIDGQDVLFRVGCEAGTYIRKLCLHPKTEILSKKGLMAASDFYFNPQKIYSFDKGKMIEKNPSATQRVHSPSKLIKIKMASGVDIIVTPDHEFLMSTKEGYKMAEAQKLKRNEYLVKSIKFPDDSKEIVISDLLDDDYYIQQEEIKEVCKKAFIQKYGSVRAMYRKLKIDRKAFLSKSKHAITIRHLKLAGVYEEFKKKIHTFKTQKGSVIKMKRLDKDFFYLLGLVASDGNNTKEKKTARYTRVKFHNKEESLIDKFLETYKRLFPSIPISKKKMTESLWQLDTTNSFLATIAASLGIKSPQKDSNLLPITNCKPNLIKAFLRGYFDGDGSAYYKKKTKVKGQHSYIRFHTTSNTNADRLHKMLLKLDIPNKIFHRKALKVKNTIIPSIGNRVYTMHDISLESPAAKKKFIKEIGSNHPFKIAKFKQILSIKEDLDIGDHYHIGFHFKEEIRKNKSKLHKLGGNLHRVLSTEIPITRGLYKKALKPAKLTPLDDFIIERIKSVEEVKGTGYVYDMTVPVIHNFLIETGFVSSNCHDIGQKIGCGAHMAELRRTKAGPFDESSLVTLQDLTDALWYYKNEGNEKFIRKAIQPVENAVAPIPKIWVFDTTANSLCHGSDLKMPGISKLNSKIKKDDLAAIMTLKDELICLGKARFGSEQIKRREKGVAVKVEKVFMAPETYPKT